MNQGKGAAAGRGGSFRYTVSGLSVDIRATRGASTTGDEPFYLLTTQSLLADGDFDLRNQYETRSYESFFDHPDGLWQQSVPLPDGDLLSPHHPGLSILLIPGFALGGLVVAQAQLPLLAAAAMALAFVLADRLTGRRLVSWIISQGVNSRDLVPPIQQQGRPPCPDEASTSRQQNSQSRAILSGTLLNVEFPQRVHGPFYHSWVLWTTRAFCPGPSSNHSSRRSRAGPAATRAGTWFHAGRRPNMRQGRE